MTERCGQWMPVAGAHCCLASGHAGGHRRTGREAYLRSYYEANREARIAYQNAYYEANREARIAYAKAYREANPEREKEWQDERTRSGRRAEAAARIRRRKADERDNKLEKELLGWLV